MPTTITTKTGNLLDITKGHIVHGCNAQGVMGSGVALAVKQKYPQVFQDYMHIHKGTGLHLGESYPVIINTELIIWNAITQEFFGRPVRNCSYDAIQACFRSINDHIVQGLEGTSYMQPNEIHIPMIGAGLGGGNWNIIKTIIEETVDYPVTLWILPS